MTAPPEMRDLALRLLTYEADADKTSELMESAVFRVYEKLRQSLDKSIGVTGFTSLAARALTLTQQDLPCLSAARVAEDGSLQGLVEIENQIGVNKDQADERGIVLIARLLGLLRIFLGEALTLSLLRNAWPDEAFDDRYTTDGRIA